LPENIKAEGVLETYRAHIFGFTFFPENINKNINDIKSNKDALITTSASFGLKKSIFLNNK
jgi:hypothetical protein